MAEAVPDEFLNEMEARATHKQITNGETNWLHSLPSKIIEPVEFVGYAKLMVSVKSCRLVAVTLQTVSCARPLALEQHMVAVEKLRDSLDARAARGRRKQIFRRRRPIKKAVRFFSTSNRIVSALRYTREIKAIRKELAYIASQYNQWDNMLRMPLETASQTQAVCVETGPLTCEEVIGRDHDRGRLVVSLLGSSIDQVFELAIVGLGGIAKNRALNHLNVPMWTVFHPVNMMSQMAWRWYWLHPVASREKFFLVIDDVSDHMDHMNVISQEVKQQLWCGGAGSMVSTTLCGATMMNPLLRTPNSPGQLKQLAVTKYLTTQSPTQTRDFRLCTRKTKKKDKVEEPDYDNQSFHFLMSFSLATSCLMLCLLPLITDEEVMSGTFLVLELPYTIIVSVSLTLAATTSLLSLETMPRRRKFAHSCGLFTILSLFFALAVLLSSFLLHSI